MAQTKPQLEPVIDAQFEIVVVDEKSKVKPGNIRVKRGAQLTWTAKGTAAKVSFPRIGGFQVVTKEVLDIPLDGTMSTTVVADTNNQIFDQFKNKYSRLTAMEAVTVPYSVYCDNTNSYAEGGSDPKIIVKP